MNLSLHEFKSTVRIPLGQPILLGGMTANPTDGAKNHNSLYLVLEVTATNEK